MQILDTPKDDMGKAKQRPCILRKDFLHSHERLYSSLPEDRTFAAQDLSCGETLEETTFLFMSSVESAFPEEFVR